MVYRLRAALVFGLIALVSAGPASAQAAQSASVETIQPSVDDGLQQAASVVQVNDLRSQGITSAKLFGTAGGDPAMNGLHTYLAFFTSPAEDWTVFQLGNFLSYRVLSESSGRVTIQVRESVMNNAGDIGTRTRQFTARWTPRPDGAAPGTVRVIPAR